MGAIRIGQMAGILLVMFAALMGRGLTASGSPTTATVVTIDRVCTYIAQDERHTRSQADCESTPEFRKIVDSHNISHKVEGKAVIHVTYPLKDGSLQAADLHLDGSDDHFYDLKAGDTVEIRVDAKDPAKIRAA